MKRIITLSIISIFFISAAFSQVEEGEETQKQIRKIGSFDKVKASKGINVTLIEGSKEEIEVLMENGSLNDVVTKLNNMELTIKMKTKIYKDVAIQVFVTYVTLREIDASSGANIEAENPITTDKLVLDAGTDTEIKLEIDANAVDASVSAGKIELSGTVKTQVVKANTGGKYFAFDLESDETIAKANTGGKIEVTVKESLQASVSNGGTITYKGNPAKVDKKVTMGGKIVEAEE